LLVAEPPPTIATVALLVTLGNAARPTATVNVIGFPLAPAAIEVVLVHVTAWPAALHVQPVPVAETYVKPVGSVSVTVTVPLEASAPVLLGVIVYTPFWPTTKLPTWVFDAPATGTSATTVVASVFVELEPAPPPEAVALFVAVPAGPTTLTTSEITGEVAPFAIGVVVVHVTTWPDAPHVQPVPLADAYVNADGKVSTYVSVPVVAEVPVLVTLSEYVLVLPMTKLPLCDLLACSAGAPATVVASVAVGAFEAPPPLALTLFVTLGTAAASALTLSVIALPFAPAPITVLEVQVTVWPLDAQAQPVPEAEL
jgi:hypothetical protein